MTVRQLRVEDAMACDDIVRGLPHFFGDEEGVRLCAEAVRTERGWVFDDGDGPDAFLTIEFPLPDAPEISWLAVRAGRRRHGLGRAVVAGAVEALTGEGYRLLSVLTLAASVPERGTDTYEGTRAFYRSTGFLDVREINPPGWEHAALLLVRPLLL